MAVQIQLRNDTSSNWASANPTLAAGEIGIETNTGKMKLGNGSTAWNSLAYFQPAAQEIISQIVDSAPATLDTLNELAAALGDDANFATTVTTALSGKQDVVANVSSTEIGYLDGVTSSIQTQLNAKANTNNPSFLVGPEPEVTTVAITNQGNDVLASTSFIPAEWSVTGFTSAPNQTITNQAVTIVALDPSNFLSTLSQYEFNLSGTIVAGEFSGTLEAPSGWNPMQSPMLDAGVVGISFQWLAGASQTTISATELGYLDGVTSNIQTQLNAKANLSGASFTGNISTTGTVSGTAAAATAATAASRVGYMGIPASGAGASGAYTLVESDAGELVYSTSTRTVTIPANASVPFEIGTTIVFVSGSGATTTIAINSDTLTLAGTGTTGSRTLAAHGMATATKVASTTWYISGNGLT